MPNKVWRILVRNDGKSRMSRGKTISPITSNLSSPTKHHEKVTYSGQPADGDWSWSQSEREEAAGATALLRRSHASCSWVFPSYPTISKQTSQMLSTELRSVSSAATQVASNYCVCVCVSVMCVLFIWTCCPSSITFALRFAKSPRVDLHAALEPSTFRPTESEFRRESQILLN